MTQDEFYNNISSWISKPKEEWNHITLMAYFCHKYQLKNKVRFRLVRWKNSPGLGKESRDFSKLMNTFLPENYKGLDKHVRLDLKKKVIVKVYNYINWMFDYKFRSGERSVTGTGIFLMPSMINEFERMYSKFLDNDLSEEKMSVLIAWCNENCPEIFRLHQLEDISDLKMIRYYLEKSGKELPIESMVVGYAKEVGLI
tara:strand:- start:443 stop:1039 length:597 start_codon:yes stop_codon:yes gene_type:complete